MRPMLISSPPYNLPMSQDHNATRGGRRGTTPSEQGAFVRYGTTLGQLEGLPMGSLDVVLLSSPPYADSVNSTAHGIDWTKTGPSTGNRRRGKGTKIEATLQAQLAYGNHLGQLGRMKGDALATLPRAPQTEYDVPITTWTGCYSGSWKGLLTEAAWSHPAKYSRKLIQRIYQHLRDHYGLKPGATIVDPFGGCALGGIDALLSGYHWIGIELEPAFVAAGQANITYWRHKFGPQPGSVTLLQGDSRHLRAVLHDAQVTGLVSSPPYAGAGEVLGSHNGIDYSKSKDGGKTKTPTREASGRNYGQTPGQLGAMPPGALISSPPFTNSDTKPTALGNGKGTRATGQSADRNKGDYHYGESPGNLGQLITGDVHDVVALSSPPCGDQQVGTGSATRTGWRGYTDHGGGMQAREGQLSALPMGAVVSSPPYEGSVNSTGRGIDFTKVKARNRREGRGGGLPSSHSTPSYQGMTPQRYGDTSHQLGNATGETFWAAAAVVVRECYAILPPGALAVWVCKDFLRDGHRIRFSQDWCRLCESVGFELIEAIQAYLIEDHGAEETLWGETVTHTIERKGFFRRLAEKRIPLGDDRRINHEDIVIFRRNGGASE
jgi:hypothetical protein